MSGNPEAMIQNLLSDPETMKKIGSLLGSFGADEKEQKTEGKSEESVLPPGLDNPETLLKISRMYKDITNEDDPRLTLLLALKPYLSSKRLDKVDSAIKFLKISKLTSLIGEIDIL